MNLITPGFFQHQFETITPFSYVSYYGSIREYKIKPVDLFLQQQKQHIVFSSVYNQNKLQKRALLAKTLCKEKTGFILYFAQQRNSTAGR